MEKTIFKEIIQDIAYNPILAELEMIDPTVRIEQVKVEIWKYGDKLKRKQKLQAVRNYRITLGYMEDPEHGYYCTD